MAVESIEELSEHELKDWVQAERDLREPRSS